MSAAVLPLAIYVVSAVLLYTETCLIASALDRLRHAPHNRRRNTAIFLLIIPLLLLPVIPVILLLTLDYDYRVTTRTLSYAVLLWLTGLCSAVPAYLYARRLSTPRHHE